MRADIKMDRSEKTIFTNMCMIYDDSGRVLVQDRTDPKWQGIAFPGGHVEHGEAFVDAVKREVYEETGLRVFELQMCGIKDWIRDDGTRYVVHLYKTNKFTGTLRSSDEGEVRWVDVKQLAELQLSKSMNTVLKVFFEDTVTEQFFYKENGDWVEVLK